MRRIGVDFSWNCNTISYERTHRIERVMQILDFARYIQSQTIEDSGVLDEDETEEQVLADEAEWDAQFAATQDGLKKMADKVRADIGQGARCRWSSRKTGGLPQDEITHRPDCGRCFAVFTRTTCVGPQAYRLWRAESFCKQAPSSVSVRLSRSIQRGLDRGDRAPGLTEGVPSIGTLSATRTRMSAS